MDREWSAELSESTCLAACRAEGVLLKSPPALIRLGTNAVYRLETPNGPLLGRVSPSDYDPILLTQQIVLATWLDDCGFPTSRPVQTDPTWIAGRATTFWEFLEGEPGAITNRRRLGALLRKFHELTKEYTGELPTWKPLGRLGDRLAAVDTDDSFCDEDRQLLCDWRDRLTAATEALEYVLPPGPLHGDVHSGNVITRNGNLYLIDLDRIARGPREWDLSEIVASRQLFRSSASAVEEFMQGYGWDLCAFYGVETLTQLRALFMTSWLLTLPRTPPVKREIANRMHYWRAPSPEAPVWSPV